MSQLLNNAGATGSPVLWPGGRGMFSAVGTFNGGTVGLQYLGPDGTTWLAIGAALSAAGWQLFELPPGQVRAVVAGGPPSGIYANADYTKG